MRITSIIIDLEPVEGEVHGPASLIRHKDKLWTVEEDGKERGLYPSELKLAMLIQEQVISEWPKKKTDG
jgi:hypothetical protein